MGLHFLHFYGVLVKSFQNGNFVIILLKSHKTLVPNPPCLSGIPLIYSYILLTYTSEEPVLGVCSWPNLYERRTWESWGRTQHSTQKSVHWGSKWIILWVLQLLNPPFPHLVPCMSSRSGQKIVPQELRMQLSGQNACLACMRLCVRSPAPH